MQTNSSSQALWVHSIATISWELQQLQIALWLPAGHQLWGRKWCTLDLNELCQPTPWTGRSSDREDGRDFLCEKLFCCQESASSLLSVWNRSQVSQHFQTGVALWIEKQHISRSYYHGSEKSARPRKARSHLSVLFGRCPARAPEQLL